jgi:regulator-associated protein of mTOR
LIVYPGQDYLRYIFLPPFFWSKNLSFLISYLQGFGDGSIGLFDERISSNGGKVSTIKAHNSWVVSSYLRKDDPVAITSCVSGGVKFWDVRTMRAFYHIDANYTKMPITSMAVHPCAPLLAMGSHAQFINILTFNGSQVGKVSHHDGFLGQRIGPISSLAFHPLKLMLAAGATDSIISVYSAEDGSNLSSFSSPHFHDNGCNDCAQMVNSEMDA